MIQQKKDIITIILAVIIIILAVFIFMTSGCKTVSSLLGNQEINTLKASEGKMYAIDFKQDGTMLEETNIYKAIANYPLTGKEDIDLDFKDLIVEQLNEFKESANENKDYPPFTDSDIRYYFSTAYQIVSNSDTVKSYIFTTSEYSGGAHGMQNMVSKTYNLDTEELYTIEDILVNGSADLPQLAGVVREKIRAQFDSQGIPYDEEWVDEGTSYADSSVNFEIFALEPQGITFYFPPYQVAAYAVGTVTIEVPFTDIDDIIKPEFKK